MSERQEHFVYLMARRDGDRLIAPVKVGITGNLGSRLRAIQTACPFPVAVVHCLCFPERWMAQSVERGFHKSKNELCAYGEWFDMEPITALSVLMLMIEVVLHVHGIDGDARDQVLEMVGAGSTGFAVLESLKGTSARSLQ